MKYIKLMGFNLLFFFYFSLSWTLALMAMDRKHNPYTQLSEILSIIAIILPFWTVRLLINKLYPGKNKQNFAVVWGRVVLIITFLYYYGTREVSPFDLSSLSFYYVMNIAFAISCFIYKENKSDKLISIIASD